MGEEGRPIKEDGKERGSNEAIHEEFAAHEFIGHVKERHVEQKACDAHGKACNIVNQHGKTCNPSGKEMVLDEENVDGKGHDETAQGKMEILDDVFFHGGHLLCLIRNGHRKGWMHLKSVLIPFIQFCFFVACPILSCFHVL